jgi:hypothetical protein
MTAGDDDLAGGATAAVGELKRKRRPKARRAQWTVLFYLAGDNDLEGALLRDLCEMERVGSRRGAVEVLAQVDRARGHDVSAGDWTGTRRYHVTRSATPARIASTLLAELGPTNTGDPRVLNAFVVFGARRFPARATMLVLSNHGTGFWVPPEMLSAAGPRAAGPARGVRRGFFEPTRQWLLAPDPFRGIAYDDGSSDCLDNRELQGVLAHARRVLRRPVDVVGMDACLMTMLEVAYQLRAHARVLVGSEELEPNDGWPWAAILADLVARPAMTAREVGASVVRRYLESYEGTDYDVTQSAIDLGQLDEVVGAVDELARALLARRSSNFLEGALHRAWRRSVRFFEGAYVDLHDLAGNLRAASADQAVRGPCLAIQRALTRAGGPIIAAGHVGAGLAEARGLSIYFPPYRDPSVFYRELDFARDTRWGDFLDAYLGNGRAGRAR